MSRVDVVIATFNRPQSLNRALASLVRQTTRDFTVIVVDDCSPTPVASTIDPLLQRQLAITVLRTAQNGGPSIARNLGVAAGTAPYVAFLDDDIVASDDYLATHLGVLARSPGPAASIGSARAPAGWQPSAWAYWEWWTLQRIYGGLRRGDFAMSWRQFFSGVSMLRRDDFVAIGGFDPRFWRAEDIELGARLEEHSMLLSFAWDAVAWHYAERSLESWLQIAYDYGRLQIAIDAIHPRLDWLATVRADLDGEGTFTRFGRRATSLPVVGAAGRALALKAGPALFRAGRVGPAMKALSFAYHAGYRRGLRAAERDPEAVLARVRVPRGPFPTAEDAARQRVPLPPLERAS